MKKSILITGVSGAGKSTLSNKLNELGYKAYDMEEVPDLFAMFDKKTGKPVVDHDNADLKKVLDMDWICDTEKLASIIANETSELTFYCGNASDMDSILPFFDMAILLKVGEKAMRHRLTTRTTNDFGRTAEIQDWILTWKDWWENDMKEKGAIVIDTDRNVENVIKEVIEKVTAT